MKFECDKCGKCCKDFGAATGHPGLSLLSDEVCLFEANNAKPFLKNIFGEIIIYRMNKQPCPLYENGCTIYTSRPLVCKSYPVYIHYMEEMEIARRFKFPELERFGHAKVSLLKIENCNGKLSDLLYEMSHEHGIMAMVNRFTPKSDMQSIDFIISSVTIDTLINIFRKYGLGDEYLSAEEMYGRTVYLNTHRFVENIE